jgi:hypothetical protein
MLSLTEEIDALGFFQDCVKSVLFPHAIADTVYRAEGLLLLEDGHIVLAHDPRRNLPMPPSYFDAALLKLRYLEDMEVQRYLQD